MTTPAAAGPSAPAAPPMPSVHAKRPPLRTDDEPRFTKRQCRSASASPDVSSLVPPITDASNAPGPSKPPNRQDLRNRRATSGSPGATYQTIGACSKPGAPESLAVVHDQLAQITLSKANGSTAGDVRLQLTDDVREVAVAPLDIETAPVALGADGTTRQIAPGQQSTSNRSRPLVIKTNGQTFYAHHPADCPDAAPLGAPRKRKANDELGGSGGRGAQSAGEIWERKRRASIDSRIREFVRENRTVADEDGNLSPGIELPRWLNATRDVQPTGKPGTYVLRPSKEDFETRFEEIIRIMSPIGMHLGAIKIVYPKECLGPAASHIDHLHSHPEVVPEPEPTIQSMRQHLPIHPRGASLSAPVYAVASKTPESVPISQFSHKLDPSSSPSSCIPEHVLLRRGRSWESVLANNPAGAVFYSSDNSVTPALRTRLNLPDPRLASLPGNVLHDSKQHVEGIHTPYIYLGNPYTLFAMHMEDYSAISFNLHHRGAPKMWRIVSPADYWKVEDLVLQLEGRKAAPRCSQFVRHASVFLSAKALEERGVRSMAMRQQQGEMVITWPMAYHEGWNEGGNICEAVGYADGTWKGFFAKRSGDVYRPCDRRCGGLAPGQVGIRLEFEGFEVEEGKKKGGRRG